MPESRIKEAFHHLVEKIKHLSVHEMKPQEIIDHAYDMALANLRERYSDLGIQAGKNHFSDIWARDSLFASLGALSIGDHAVVRKNLKTILSHVHKDGQVPLRIGQKHFLLKLLFGWKGRSEPRFKEDKGVSIPTDSNSLLIIIAEKYMSETKKKTFIRNHFMKFKKVVDWNFTMDHNKDLLMEEGHYAGWADSLKKRGTVLYTNVLHYEAVHSFAKICEALNKKREKERYFQLSEKIKSKINDFFWNGEYYNDWIGKTKHHTYFSTDGNVMAILFGIADKNRAVQIQKCIAKFGLDHGFTTGTNYPKYKFKHIYPFFFPLRMNDYHNGLQWLWLGCVDAVTKNMTGMKTEAKELLTGVAKKIIEFKGVYEVYHLGKPLERFFYKSEQGFAWSSGLFVWACRQVGLK